MKTKFLIILIAFSVSNIFAQTDSLTVTKQEFKDLKSKIETIELKNSNILQKYDSLKNLQSILNTDYKNLNSNFEKHKQNTEDYKKNAKTEVDSLKQNINSNSANIKTTADELGVKIEGTHKSTSQSIIDLNKTVRDNTLYWIIAVLVVTLFVLLVFILLRKQLFKQKTDLESNLEKTRKVLEEEGVKLDNKLIEVIETQLKIIKSSSSGKEPDHTLALKVADEITRIQKNLTRMDEKTKGLKQLTLSVKRIQENLASNGYEIIEMLGKKYDEGMKVSAIFILDEDLEEGKQIITRIIKPQVNYKGVMIQSAQIEVSQGDKKSK